MIKYDKIVILKKYFLEILFLIILSIIISFVSFLIPFTFKKLIDLKVSAILTKNKIFLLFISYFGMYFIKFIYIYTQKVFYIIFHSNEMEKMIKIML